MGAKKTSPADGEGLCIAARKKLKLEFDRLAVLLVGAGRVDRHAGVGFVRPNQLLFDQITFHFFAADVGQHLAVHFHAGRKRLAALAFHLPAEGGILDDIFFSEREIVFGEDGADAAAPAAMGFEVGGDLWLFHGRR